MASTLPPEKRRRGMKTAAAGAAPHRKGGGAGGTGLGGTGTTHVREDPHHTWNQQLMEACFACDVAAVRKLIERGADPVKAREVPPLDYYIGPIMKELQLQQRPSSEPGLTTLLPAMDTPRGAQSPQQQQQQQQNSLDGSSLAPPPVAAGAAAAAPADAAVAPDSLPPLAAMLLSGLNTPAALEVMKELIQHGASVNDVFSFSTPPFPAARPGADICDDDNSGVAVDGTSSNISSGRGKKTTTTSLASEGKSKQPSGKRKASVIGPVSTASFGGGAALTGIPGSVAPSTPDAPLHEEGTTTVGSVLHYVVAHGDHAQLMRLLLLSATAHHHHHHHSPGDKAPVSHAPFPVPLPYTLLAAVEAETVVGAVRRQYQQRLSSIADAAVLGGSQPTSTSPRTAQSKKNRVAGNPNSPSRTSTLSTVVAPAEPSGPVSATTLASPSAAEAVLTALQQTLLQRQTSTGGYRGLPILTSVYPQQQRPEEIPKETSYAPTVGGNSAATAAGDDDAAAAAAVVVAPPPPCNWWNLARLFDAHDGVSTEGLHQRTSLNFELLDTCGRSAATTALERGDALSVRLLSFFGAHIPFDGQVNASQTRLARACAQGDVARVEALLRQGDSVTQLSADGRYTLVHYAAAQPSVLRTLVEHGLSLEAENAFGDSAVASLLRHGTARNDPRYVQTLLTLAAAVRNAATDGVTNPVTASIVNSMSATASNNAVHFAELSTAVHRNMIMCPPAPMAALTVGGAPAVMAPGHRRAMGNGNSHGVTAQATASNSGNVSGPSTPQPFLGGCEVGTWWSFLPPTVTTAELLETLLRAGAMVQGFVPDEELDLPYVQFAERQAAAFGETSLMENEEDELRYEEAGDDDDDNEGMEDGDIADGEDVYRDADGGVHSASTSGYKMNPRARSTSAEGLTSYFEQRDRNRRRRHQRLAVLLPARLPLRLTPLQHAIFDYHPELIRRLLVDYRVDPMHRDSQGATALHYAALCAHAPSVLELLIAPQTLAPMTAAAKTRTSGGFNSDSSIGAGLTAFSGISSPAAAGAPDVNIDLNAIDMAGRTPLFYAAYVGNTTAVQQLIGFGGATLLCGKADKNGYTPLHIAVQQRHADIVELLIRHSNQVLNSIGGGGGGRGQLTDVLTELFASTAAGGASTGRPSRGISRRNSHRSNHDHGTRAVGRLAPSNPAGALNPELLANVEAEENVTQMTALEMAVKAHHQLQPLASASLSGVSEAEKDQLLRIVSLLLGEAQASPLRPSGLANGGALLHRAVADGAVELTGLLLSHYADPNEVDNVNETPLFLALRLATPVSATQVISAEQKQQHRRRRASIVRVLLQHGATPYAQSVIHLQTPLHLAASSLADDDEIIQLMFYTTPESGGGSVAVRRRRQEHHQRGLTVPHRASNTDGVGQRDDPLGGSIAGNMGARRLPSSGTLLPGAGRRSFLERRGRERRTQQQQQQQQQQRCTSQPSSVQLKPAPTSTQPRRKAWKGASGNLSENEHSVGPADLDRFFDDQLSLASSTYIYRETRNNSFASIEQVSADTSLMQTTTESPLGGGGGGGGNNIPYENGPQDEHEQFLRLLARWQCADHLLAPEECWMLTDAQGQTPLHVLCSRASRALQRMPAVLKLLEDLKTVTRAYSAMACLASGVYDDARSDDHLLALCWRLPDAHGRTPLHVAAQSGFVQAMECILQHAPQTVLAVDMQGRTPLHACVLMTTSASPAPAAPAAISTNTQVEDDEAQYKAAAEEAAERATTLRRMLSLLHSVVADEKTTLCNSDSMQLQGAPLLRAGADILPSLSTKTTMQIHSAFGGAKASHTSVQRAVVSLVTPSSITAQLQRWQQLRHWGCPALARKTMADTGAVVRDGVAGSASRHLSASGSALTTSSAGSVWKTYAQLPDGQGRTALLLAAEVGNISAARELLKII